MPILKKVMVVAPYNVDLKYQECNMRAFQLSIAFPLPLLQNAVNKST